LAFADSTVFSNFEIFYPGKYEYLVNGVHWLNHADAPLATFVRRCALLALGLGFLWALWRWRSPRGWLQVWIPVCLAWGVAGPFTRAVEAMRTRFPEPIHPANMLFFAADASDPGYALRAFTSEAKYNQRYDVFIQWVLRTGAFSAFYVLGPEHRPGLYEHMRAASKVQTGLGLIIRRPDELAQLERVAKTPAGQSPRVLVMFSKDLQWPAIATALRRAGWLTESNALTQARRAWPASEALCEDHGRRVLVVFDAERFSDEAMGFTEKVVPNATQRVRFNQAFALVDRLFGQTPPAKTPATGASSTRGDGRTAPQATNRAPRIRSAGRPVQAAQTNLVPSRSKP